MAELFYAKSPENRGYIKNLEVLGYHGLHEANIFQMALHKTKENRYYLYCSSFASLGVVIVEVTDPRNPRFVKKFMPVDPEEYPATRSPKIQVANGLMIVALSSGGGPAIINQNRKPSEKKKSGVHIYHIEDEPENPEFLSYWDNGVPDGYGVHRFCYNGGRYVHLSSDCAGFEGMIYRILDIQDATKPIEVGRWWLPEQFVDGVCGECFDPAKPHSPAFMDKGHLHGPPYVVGDKCYMGYSGAGLCILDIGDIARPRLLGQLKLHPVFGSEMAGSRCHTVLPLPGRDFAVVTNEGERFAWFEPGSMQRAQAMNNLHMIDIRDPANPVLIAEFPYPEVPEGYPYPNFNECGLGCQGPFGPHNLHEPMSGKPWLDQDPNQVYCCYFHAGLRIYDVSDPYYIKETAYFIPPYPEKRRFPNYNGPMLPSTEDCVVDDRGMIYIDAMEDGLYILKITK